MNSTTAHRRLALALSAWGIAMAFTTASPTPANALIRYPYCMKVYTRDQYEDCSYSTLAQCQFSASGRSAQCYRDPFYDGPPGSPYVIKQPRVPYSLFGSNIDPSYDPYRMAPPTAPSRHVRHKQKRKTHHAH